MRVILSRLVEKSINVSSTPMSLSVVHPETIFSAASREFLMSAQFVTSRGSMFSNRLLISQLPQIFPF